MPCPIPRRRYPTLSNNSVRSPFTPYQADADAQRKQNLKDCRSNDADVPVQIHLAGISLVPGFDL